MDRFLEEVVTKRNKTANEIMYVISLITMVVMAVLAFMGLQMLLFNFHIMLLVQVLLMGGTALYLFLMRDRLRTEYEYTFTNGDLDFAQVFNNRKRKNLGSLKVRNVEAFGPVSGSAFQRLVNTPDIKRHNWFLNRDADLYFFYFSKDGAKKMIILEPSPEMVSYIKHYLNHGVCQA